MSIRTDDNQRAYLEIERFAGIMKGRIANAEVLAQSLERINAELAMAVDQLRRENDQLKEQIKEREMVAQ